MSGGPLTLDGIQSLCLLLTASSCPGGLLLQHKLMYVVEVVVTAQDVCACDVLLSQIPAYTRP
jgi:hypothetical protein